MKILIVDRENITAQLMKSRLEPLGHKITEEPSKNDAIEHISKDTYDMIFIDPSPLTSARPLILNLRRAASNYPYIVQMSQTITLTEAVQSGANDAMEKPIDPEALEDAIDNAKRLTTLIKRIGDDNED